MLFMLWLATVRTGMELTLLAVALVIMRGVLIAMNSLIVIVTRFSSGWLSASVKASTRRKYPIMHWLVAAWDTEASAAINATGMKPAGFEEASRLWSAYQEGTFVHALMAGRKQDSNY